MRKEPSELTLEELKQEYVETKEQVVYLKNELSGPPKADPEYENELELELEDYEEYLHKITIEVAERTFGLK